MFRQRGKDTLYSTYITYLTLQMAADQGRILGIVRLNYIANRDRVDREDQGE